MKDIVYRIEAFALSLLFALFRVLPLDVSSAIGSFLGPIVGSFFSAHKIALTNLARAFPENSEEQNKNIRKRMWQHLGRVAGEFASLGGKRLINRVNVIGAEHLPKPGSNALFFSGHIGNWEMLYPIAFHRDIPIGIVYRHINNPYVDKMIENMRKQHATTMITKGVRGSVHLIRALKRGESVAMLVDQKMNNGMAIPFFGRDAMTSTAVAELALKYDLPILPTRIVRKRGAHFDGYVFPPLEYEKTGDHDADVKAIMVAINAYLEKWIRECPEQWFWVHKRWPKDS